MGQTRLPGIKVRPKPCFAQFNTSTIDQGSEQEANTCTDSRYATPIAGYHEPTGPTPFMVGLLNRCRELSHLPPLVDDPKLSQADRLHTECLVRNFPEAIRSGVASGRPLIEKIYDARIIRTRGARLILAGRYRLFVPIRFLAATGG
jgi:hypothetical protein